MYLTQNRSKGPHYYYSNDPRRHDALVSHGSGVTSRRTNFTDYERKKKVRSSRTKVCEVSKSFVVCPFSFTVRLSRQQVLLVSLRSLSSFINKEFTGNPSPTESQTY